MSNEVRPGIGIATIVVNGNSKILVGRDSRKGETIYGVPGGHWENGETLKQGAIREVKEESGIDCDNVDLVSVYDFYREDKGKSYVSIGLKAEYVSGKLQDNPEEERTAWAWYEPEEALKLDLFPADRVLLERYFSGVVFE